MDKAYFLDKDGIKEIYEGVTNKLYTAIDPASAFGDYGCAAVYRMNDAGDMEIIHVEYLEPKK